MYSFKPFIDTSTNANEIPATQGIHTTPIESPTQTNATVGLHFEKASPSATQQPATMNFEPGAIDTTPYATAGSIGLNVTAMPEPNVMQVEESPAAKIQIDHLLVNDTANIPTQKFAVQSIPIDADRSMLPSPDKYEIIANDLNTHLSKQTQAKPEFVIRKMNSWISRLIDQRGEDYITSGKLTVDEVSRNSERIIDDMIAGRIDYTKYGQYLIRPEIIETLIQFCVNKLAINKAIQYSLGYIYNDYTNRYNINPEDTERIKSLNFITDNLSRNITQAISIVNQDIAIYEIVYNRLTYVQSTKNASSLFNLASELNYARKQLKKRY